MKKATFVAEPLEQRMELGLVEWFGRIVFDLIGGSRRPQIDILKFVRFY